MRSNQFEVDANDLNQIIMLALPMVLRPDPVALEAAICGVAEQWPDLKIAIQAIQENGITDGKISVAPLENGRFVVTLPEQQSS